MSITAIAKITNAELATSEADEIFWTSELDDDTAFDLIPQRLSVASSGAKAFVDSNDDMIQAPITCVVIGAIKTRGLWLTDSNKIPFCASTGGVKGKLRSDIATLDDIPQGEFDTAVAFRNPHPAIPLLTEKKPLPESFDCGEGLCPMMDWVGTNNSRPCKEKRALLILPDGWLEPAILQVPTMSIGRWDAYASGLRGRQRTRYFGARTEIDVEKAESKSGKPYGRLIFKLVERFNDPALAAEIVRLQKAYMHLLDREDIVVADNYDVDATPVVESTDADEDIPL